MMEKVMLTQLESEVLEDLKRNYYSAEEFVCRHSKGWHWGQGCECLNKMSLDTLIRALYIGYEVEKTPEAIIWEEYQYQRDPNEAANDSFADGMKFVVDTLNIKIKGINE